MCGISGIIKKQSVKVEESDLLKLAQTMKHRGPDALGIFRNNNVGFSHNRLSLLDLSAAANQPFKNENFVLTYNGEIYNWKNLKSELELLGIVFKTTSDTEVLFWGIIEWGLENTLQKLNGMFAFSWHDIKENKIFLVRDRLGIKPLFYSISSTQISFASEIKALSQDIGMYDLNMHYLAQSYYGVYETQRHISPFKNIHQLEPGHILTIDTNSLDTVISKWFSLGDWVNELEYSRRSNMSESEVLEEFSELMNNSVRSMMLADAPVGAFVSGGLDSSLIAALGSENSSMDLFTANVVGKYSEVDAARQLASFTKNNLYEYTYESNFFVRDLVRSTWHYDAPITLFTNSVAFGGVAKLARETNVKAVLTGEGADELFLGYPKLLTQKFDKIINLPFNAINAIYKKIPGLTSYLNLNRTDLQKEIIQQHLNGYKERLNDESVMKSFSFLNRSSEEYRCAQLTVNMIHRHLHSLLWRNDRMGMIHSIESRFPYLDNDVVKFALNLPAKFKIGRTSKFYNWKHPFQMDKAVLRKFAEKKLPQNLAHKKKFGFGVQGHANSELKIDLDFFRGGFWQQACGMNNQALELMYKEANPKLLAKLSSVEVWGRLVVLKQPIEDCQQQVLTHFKM